MYELAGLAATWVSCLVLSGVQASAEPSQSAAQRLEARFESELAALHRKYGFPGATAAYVLPDGTVGRVAVGLADVEAGTHMSPRSRMLAASIGKSLFGAEAIALAQDGKLNLDDRLSTWLGDRPWLQRLPNGSTTTLRQLLQHTAGVPDHVYMKAFEAHLAAHWQDDRVLSPEDQIAFVLDQQALFKAGEGWAYSDTGYLVAGLALQRAAGRDLYREIEARFILPLGLTATSPSDGKKLPGLAAGYLAPENRFGLPVKTTIAPGVMAWNPALEWAGGGFVSNSGDLALWAKALYEGRAIPGEYLGELLRGAPVNPEAPGVRYGIGVGMKDQGPNGPSLGHGGWIPGYVSSMRYYPGYRIAVAFQVNSDIALLDDESGAYDEIESRLARVVIEAIDPPVLPGFSFAGSAAQRSLEARLDDMLSSEKIGRRQREMSTAPLHIGSPHNKALAERVRDELASWGWEARIETFDVLFPMPRRMRLEMRKPVRHRARFDEPPIPEDETTLKVDSVLPAYLAYAADGRVIAPLVYVNYGMPEDYAELARIGVSVKGKIVIARFGGGWRGLKPKLAHAHGAIGCVLYSDPAEDGFAVGKVYPEGAWRPATGIQRGSVIDLPVAPGDPLTPGYGATADAKRLPRSKAVTLARIPCVPISYGDAQPFLAALTGPEVPVAWRGALPIKYRVGPGPAVVLLEVESAWDLKTLYNVVARIPGAERPNQWIIRGNNHDAWVYGAWVPLSGHSAMLEEARAIGALAQSGWRPRRTIIYASWDGEEGGLLGSTEWVETHAEDLRRHAALYVNTGINGRGFVDVSASYSTQGLVDSVTADVPDPVTAEPVRERAISGGRRDSSPVGDLGAGSDFTPFAQHLGIASIDLGFGGEDEQFGIYHSTYDTIAHFERFGDPGFHYGRALAQTAGRLVLRAANAEWLPLSPADTAARVEQQVEELTTLATSEAATGHLNLAPLAAAGARLAASARAFDGAAAPIAALDPAKRAELDDILQRFEQCWISPEGLPGRPWYRHLGYAPGMSTGYAAKTLPGVREAMEHKRWPEAQDYAHRTAQAIDTCASLVDAATALRSGHRESVK